jgi:hypothetical protein
MSRFLPAKQSAYLIAAYAIPLLITVLFIIKYSYNLPIWDQWELVPYLEKIQRGESISLAQLAEQHNEHRLLFPRLIMLALAQSTYWNVNYEVLTGFIFFSFTSLLIFFSITELFDLIRYTRRYKTGLFISFLLSAILYFSLSQSQNLLWGWQLQIFLDVLCVVAGAFYLTRGDSVQWKQIALGLVLGVIATFSFANGLTYWLVGGLILILRAKATKHIIWKALVWISTAAIAAWCYFHDFKHPANEPSVFYALYHPVNFLSFMFSCLGASIMRFGIAARISSYFAGAAGFMAIAAVTRCLLKDKVFFDKRFVFWHSLLFYSLVSCALIAVGRAGGGVELAGESRYVTITVFFWLWLSVVGIWLLTKYNVLVPILYVPGLAVFLLFFAYYTRASIIDAGNMYQKKQHLLYDLKSNNFSSSDISIIYPVTDSIVDKNVFLKQNKLSFYHL